jgi:putative ABC transport system substrate-binding protein
MQRREFITLLGGAAAVWPLAARAQPGVPTIGYISVGAQQAQGFGVAAFRKGLSEIGFIEGRNLAIEFRWAQNDRARLPELAADLIRRRVSVIASPGSALGAVAAQSQTNTIPIVFSTSSDPVPLGLVSSLNRPGGNVTGYNDMNVELGAKRLGLLHEMLPRARRFAMLVNPTNPYVESVVKDVIAAAATIGRPIEILYVGTDRELEAAFPDMVRRRAEALLLMPDVLLNARVSQILTLTARHAMPAIYAYRDSALAGGLMSYGPIATDQHRQVGIYTGRILKGEKAGDLPVARATKFEFIINLQSARAFDIEVPPTLLAIADEVIE